MPIPNPLPYEHYWDFFAKLCGAIVAVGTFWVTLLYPKVIKVAIERSRFRRSEQQRRYVILDDLAEERVTSQEERRIMMQEITSIKKQVSPNGGGSLPDKQDKMFKKMSEMEVRFDVIEAQRRFDLNTQNIAYWYSGGDGGCTYISPAACKMLKRLESEILGFNWGDYIVERDAERIKAEWKETIYEKRTFDEIYSFEADGGGEIKVHAMAFHTYHRETGKYVCSYGTLTKL